MVLEQIFKLKWVEKKEHSFFLGFFYSLIGILSAYYIMPSYLGLISIAFTSLLLIPSLNALLSLEENIEVREKKLDIIQLLKDHYDIVKVYLFLFLGIFSAYFLIGLVIPQESSLHYFGSQLELAGLLGKATGAEFFYTIFTNNLKVFIAAFLLSFFYGAGAILFLTINASTWGVTFGYMGRQVMESTGALTIASFILPVLPHTITEALSYVLAAIIGGIVSKAVLREKLWSKKFNHIVTDALIFLVIGMILVLIAGGIELVAFTYLN